MSVKQRKLPTRRDFLAASATAWAAGMAIGSSDAPVFADDLTGRRTFSHPHRIRYDRRSLLVENKPFFLYSGSFHYCRAPRELWAARFAKIRDAGFNTVQTYTPWNFHEPQMPDSPDDFSRCDMHLLDEFLGMAAEYGLYTVVRVGPYMCGEWDTGGYPQWLIPKIPPHHRGMWLRTNAAGYTPWANHWMRSVCPTVARHQITRKAVGAKGVILVQVENEYGLIGIPTGEKKAHLQDLINQARSNGIEVPLFTNLAGFILGSHDRLASEVFDTIDRYPGWQFPAMLHRIRHYRTGQPDAPVMAAELQGGYFTSVSAKPYLHTSRDLYAGDVSPEQLNALTLFSMQHGMTALNYYMLFGGTNFAGRASVNVATTYDYCAPIRENGGVGAKWLKAAAIGKMIQRHGPSLARAVSVAIAAAGAPRSIQTGARKAPDGSHFIFIQNLDRERSVTADFKAAIAGLGRVALSVKLAPADFKILYLPAGITAASHGQWLPPTVRPLRRPGHLPGAVRITHASSAPDALPGDFVHVPRGRSLAAMGIYDSGFTYYRARINVDKHGQAGPAAVTLQLNGQDSATISHAGKAVYASSRTGSPAMFPLNASPADGLHDVLILHDNVGHPDNGFGLESSFGITAAGMTGAPDPADRIGPWRYTPVKLPRDVGSLPEIQPDASDAHWRLAHTAGMAPQEVGHLQAAVFRTELTITDADIRRQRSILRFGVISTRAWIFVNGKGAGMAGGFGATIDLSHVLRRGRNVVALVVQELGHWGGIGEPALISQPDAWGGQSGELELAAAPGGRGWQTPEFDDSQWVSGALPQVSGEQALLTWYRMKFSLPHVQSDIWVPWCLKIAGHGNGFIYINGHNIGRIWEFGGQREFFLPDCWLEPAGKQNVIALCLRGVDKPAALHAASVVPYRVYAEYKTRS